MTDNQDCFFKPIKESKSFYIYNFLDLSYNNIKDTW